MSLIHRQTYWHTHQQYTHTKMRHACIHAKIHIKVLEFTHVVGTSWEV